MANKITASIRKEAVRIIQDNPDGIRFSELRRRIKEANDSFNINTITGVLKDIDTRVNNVEKPSRGIYRTVSADPEGWSVVAPKPLVKEEEFYSPFADWLENDVEDVTKAIPLGGSRFTGKWRTPDVIGKRHSKRSDIIQSPIEIVSAEIKTNTSQLIEAFGQACAYCLFSHRSYLVVPFSATQEDRSRLDSLCQIFGIGFVLFDAQRPEDPKFEIRVRPKKQDPDIFYTNKHLKVIESELFP